jgi:hypothetical protein
VGQTGGTIGSELPVDARGHVYVAQLLGDEGAKTALVELDGDLARVAETRLDHAGPEADVYFNSPVLTQRMADRWPAFVTDRGLLYRLEPAEGDRPAKVTQLGNIHPRGAAAAAALFSPDGRRYLMGPARRHPPPVRPYDWLVYDLKTGHSVVVPFPQPREDGREFSRLSLSGAMTRDNRGRLYVGGACERDGTARPVLLQISLPR